MSPELFSSRQADSQLGSIPSLTTPGALLTPAFTPHILLCPPELIFRKRSTTSSITAPGRTLFTCKQRASQDVFWSSLQRPQSRLCAAQEEPKFVERCNIHPSPASTTCMIRSRKKLRKAGSSRVCMGPIIRKQGDGVLGSQIAGTVRASKACRRCHDARRKCVALARDIGCVRCKGFQLVCNLG